MSLELAAVAGALTRASERLRKWQFPGAVYGLAVAADGCSLTTANSNGTVYVLRLAD